MKRQNNGLCETYDHDNLCFFRNEIYIYKNVFGDDIARSEDGASEYDG